MAWIQTQHNGVVFDLILFGKLGILMIVQKTSSHVVCRAYRCLQIPVWSEISWPLLFIVWRIFSSAGPSMKVSAFSIPFPEWQLVSKDKLSDFSSVSTMSLQGLQSKDLPYSCDWKYLSNDPKSMNQLFPVKLTWNLGCFSPPKTSAKGLFKYVKTCLLEIGTYISCYDKTSWKVVIQGPV